MNCSCIFPCLIWHRRIHGNKLRCHVRALKKTKLLKEPVQDKIMVIRCRIQDNNKKQLTLCIKISSIHCKTDHPATDMKTWCPNYGSFCANIAENMQLDMNHSNWGVCRPEQMSHLKLTESFACKMGICVIKVFLQLLYLGPIDKVFWIIANHYVVGFAFLYRLHC